MNNDAPTDQRPHPFWAGVRFAGLLIIVFLLGVLFSGRIRHVAKPSQYPPELRKFEEVLRLVDRTYVDAPDDSLMIEGAIEGMLRKLDPHSVYIPPQEQERVQERFDGEFSGIGIQFEIRDDLLSVISPIPGTPADRMGLRAGDRIVKIDGVSAIGITNDQVFKRLRGPEGTQVTITVQRPGREDDPFDLKLTRGKIPIHSIQASFLLPDGKTGYIMVSQFTAVTEDEFEEALEDLEKQGMKQLILDLRGNSGGYRAMAREVVDKFIKGGSIILTTKGRARGASDTLWATDEATHPYMPLVVLVNRGSASASEIVAGAIQDLDRGLIMGSSTFGKGLVQLPFELRDGSVVRITISRWYTPSGRCIQRPYDEGIGEYYEEALGMNGAENDSSSASAQSPHRTASNKLDAGNEQKYFTRTGRVVYSGRGVLPDKSIDPGTLSRYGTKLVREQVLINYANAMADTIRKPWMPFPRFRDEWMPSEGQVKGLIDFAEKQGISFDAQDWEQDRDFLLNQVKGELAQRLYNGRDYLWQILISQDPVVDSAVVAMPEADSLANAMPLREDS
ncbi:MAG: S41 family peptidase [bacterium]